MLTGVWHTFLRRHDRKKLDGSNSDERDRLTTTQQSTSLHQLPTRIKTVELFKPQVMHLNKKGDI